MNLYFFGRGGVGTIGNVDFIKGVRSWGSGRTGEDLVSLVYDLVRIRALKDGEDLVKKNPSSCFRLFLYSYVRIRIRLSTSLQVTFLTSP